MQLAQWGIMSVQHSAQHAEHIKWHVYKHAPCLCYHFSFLCSVDGQYYSLLNILTMQCYTIMIEDTHIL